MKSFFFISLLLLLQLATHAQIFPIQVTPQITPPYSPYLSDYTAPGSQNFVIHINANDVSVADYHCKLRLTIEGVGITIRTKADFITTPLVLQGGGTPQTIYGEDLYEYFHPDALDFAGYERSEYQQSARLPEGVYRFTVEVLDYNRGTVVSNKGMTMAWITLNDPPMLNMPANFSKLPIQDPTNILFTWTPRHTGSPNAAFTTEYIFRLIELWPENRNPYDAFLTQPPLFETTTAQNQILYGLSEPALIPGRKYAWQVEARDTQGKDLFKNHGRSEVFVFQFGEALPIPENLKMRWAKPTTLAIRWDPIKSDNQEEVKYRLQWRPLRRTGKHEWYETRTKFTDKTLYDLRASTEYEMKIRSENGTQQSAWSEIQVFKTLLPEENKFVCKAVTPPPLPDNTLPVFPLSINDTIHAGGYKVLVRDVMEDNGKYYGSGLAIVPWFNSAKVRVTFENIRVNDQFWLTSGTIKSTWNPESKFMFQEQSPIKPGTAPQAGELDITVVAVDSLITVTGAAVASVTKDEAGNIVVITTDGKEQTLSKKNSYAIVDETGNGYIIDTKGNIAKTTANEATAAATRGNRTYHLIFRFAKGDGRFGFDERKFEALSPYYQQLEDGTYIPWKALSSARPDTIAGKLESGETDYKSVSFEVGGTPVIPASSQQGNVILNLQGKAGGMEEELLALFSPADTVPPKVLGKVNLVTYNPIRYNVVIVPVNSASLPTDLAIEDISKKLNDVYGQAVVTWNVSLSQTHEVALNKTFDEGAEAGLFTNYTPDMKKVLKAFGRFKDNTYYLFLIQEPRNPNSLGYMPRSKQAGFVFVAPHKGDTQDLLKTIAHELGHGAFNLQHTFSEHNLPMGITDNVMDYSKGTALYKYQWDYIHEPQAVMGLFEGDEEGESVLVTNMSQLKAFANKDGSFTFLAPTGRPFTLPPSTQAVKFLTNDMFTDDIIPADESPDGALIAFTIENQIYRYHKIAQEKSGTGYKIEKGGLPYVDNLSKGQRDLQHAIIGLPCVENGQVKFIAQRVQFHSDLSDENYSAAGDIVSKLPIDDPYGPYFTSARITLDASLDFTYTDEAKAFISDNQACMNEMVRFVIKAANVIQRNPGYYESYIACTGNALKFPQSGSTETEDAFLYGLYYEKLKSFADDLLDYVNQARYADEELLSVYDPDALSSLLKNTCEPDFRSFTFEQRKHIIGILLKGNVQDYWLGIGNNRENIVIYTLTQAPEDQFDDILNLLQESSYALLKTLIAKCDNQLIGEDNFDRLIDAVTVMIQKTYVYENFEEDISNDRILRWGANDLFKGFGFECHNWVKSSSENITFSSSTLTHHYPAGGEYTGVRIATVETGHTPLEVAPFDFVVLKLYDDIVLESGKPILKKSVGEFQAIPAIYLYWMIQRKATDRTLEAIKANVNLALFLVGGAELIAARTTLRLSLAIIDQTLFTTSFVLAAGPRRMLEEGPNGEEWQSIFKAFDAFNMLYGAARLGQGLSVAGRDILSKRALLNKLKESEDWTSFTPSQQNLAKAEIARVEKGMDELGRVVDGSIVADNAADLLSVLNKLSKGVQDKIKLLPASQREVLLKDLHDSPSLLVEMKPALVDSWEALSGFSTIRKNPANLETLNKFREKFSYNGKTGHEALKDVFSAHRSAKKFINNLNKADELFKGVGIKHWSGIKSSGEVRLINDAGEVIGKVDNGVFTVTSPKGSRPAPHTYLTQKYIDDHLARFEAEGSAFVVVKSWIEESGHNAFPFKKYVMLQTDMQSAIAKYKNSGLIEDLEDALGYARGDLAGLEGELFVFYVNKPKFKFEFPDGNEDGANGLWKPGGKTAGGYREAVLIDNHDPSKQIVHHNDIEFLKHTFSWQKINH